MTHTQNILKNMTLDELAHLYFFSIFHPLVVNASQNEIMVAMVSLASGEEIHDAIMVTKDCLGIEEKQSTITNKDQANRLAFFLAISNIPKWDIISVQDLITLPTSGPSPPRAAVHLTVHPGVTHSQPPGS